MKKLAYLLLLPLTLFFCLGTSGPHPYPTPPSTLETSKLQGAWRLVSVNGQSMTSSDTETYEILSHNYTMLSTFNRQTGAFISSSGGSYEVEGNTFTQTLDFHTTSSELVGTSQAFDVTFNKEDEITAKATLDGQEMTFIWRRVDKGDNDLAGEWRIRARHNQEGNMVDIHQTGPRKTVKILSATRFQWTAMNHETREFFGCGGGTYTFKDGVYTEKIEFFSRDSSRVGMSLSFEGKVDGDDWHHSGKSSKGDPIAEIWARQ